MSEIPDEFRDLDLYQVLSLESNCSEAEIKKAYRKCALRAHPDKGGDATEFHKIAFAFSILGDTKRRAHYDQHGLEDDFDEAVRSAYAKFKDIEITPEMIEEDKLLYRAKEEREDAIKFYSQYKGDFGEIMQRVLHTGQEDEDRIKGVIEEALKSGELKPYKAFAKTTSKKMTDKRKKTSAREASKAAKVRAKIGMTTSTEGDLAALIKARQQGSSFIDQLQSKYC